MKKALLSLALLAAVSATADQPSHNYVGIGHIQGDNSDGKYAEASYAFSDHIYAVASYATTDYDYLDADANGFSVGVGYSLPTGDSTIWFIDASYIDAEVEVWGYSESDNGYGLETGFRSMVTENIELGVSVDYVDIFDDTESDVNAYAQYHVTENFGILVDVSSASEYNYGVGIRYNF